MDNLNADFDKIAEMDQEIADLLKNSVNQAGQDEELSLIRDDLLTLLVDVASLDFRRNSLIEEYRTRLGMVVAVKENTGLKTEVNELKMKLEEVNSARTGAVLPPKSEVALPGDAVNVSPPVLTEQPSIAEPAAEQVQIDDALQQLKTVTNTPVVQ